MHTYVYVNIYIYIYIYIYMYMYMYTHLAGVVGYEARLVVELARLGRRKLRERAR